MFIVFDLDGTLALNDHRAHFVDRPAGEKKDWDAFFEACDGDQPNMPVSLPPCWRFTPTAIVWRSGRAAVPR